jgi:RHS repeat-associated protein
MGIVQLLAPGGLQLSYPRLKRAAVADLGTVESFPDQVQGGDLRRAEDGSMILVGKQQNWIYSIEDPDATTPTVLGPVPLNSGGYTFVLHPNMALQPLVITKDSPVKQRSIGEKHYELSDHLGNVRVVVSDIKMGTWNSSNTAINAYRPQLLSRADYYAFGSLLPGRNYSSDSYRFGFNGKENDNDVYNATGTFQDYGMRMYDPRIGRFPSVDPIAAQYPELTPYQFASNTPIQATDLDGLEADFSAGKVAPLKYTNPQWIHATAAVNTAGAAWNTLVDLSELVVNILPPYNAFNEGAGYEKVGKGFASAATGAYDWTVNTSGAQKRADLATTFSNPHTYTNAAGSLVVGGVLGKLGGASKLAVATEGTTVSATAPLRFSQSTASAFFSEEGAFAGRSIASVADDLRAGTMSPMQVPVQTLPGAGSTLIVNTRSSLALRQAGIPQSSWNLQSMAGVTDVEMSIANRLSRNNLTGAGTDNLRITGRGSNASTYRP